MKTFVSISCILLLTSLPAAFAKDGRASFTAVPATVEQLPVERFDEYPAGSFPPAPWFRSGTPAQGVSLALEPEGESRFIGNTETGKGLVLVDENPSAGQGAGVRTHFAPPPPGRLYLGYDFQLKGGNVSGEGLDFTCELSDASGRAIRVRMGEGGLLTVVGLTAPSSDVPPQTIAPLVAGVWYHLAFDFTATGTVTISLSERQNAERQIKQLTMELGNGASPASRPAFTELRFFSAGPDVRTGGWALDNICMAGEVAAPRTALLPFTPLPAEQLRASARKVFAYYYEVYPSGYSDKDPGLGHYIRTVLNPTATRQRAWLKDRVDAGTELLYHPLPRPRMEAGLTPDEVLVRMMEDEIRVARLGGLDGFLLDFFAWPSPHSGAVTFNKRSFALLEAAARIDPSFKIIPAIYSGKAPEGASLEESAEYHASSAVLQQALAHPQTLKLDDGRPVLSMWLTERHPPEWWKLVLAKLEARGIRVAFIGQFNGLSRERLQSYAPLCAGMADWGPRSPIEYNWVSRVRDLTPIVISPVVMQDARTRRNTYWEACGGDTLRGTWNAAITGPADWVFLITWSDYSEQAMAPSTAIGFAPHDLNTYYAQWFKTGEQPPITRDVLYYFHRRHHTGLAPARGLPWKIRSEGAGNEFASPRDEIELLAFLKEPGELRIQIEDTTHTFEAPAGITSFKVPLPEGRAFAPVFSLVRDSRTVVSGQSRYAVLGKIEYANLLYHGGVIPAPETSETP